MAEHTPTTETVRDCFVDGAAGEFIGEDFDRWLTAHDAELRAELERLREGAGRALVDRDAYRAELDEARQQLADLRAGIEALADTKPGATGRALRALLAGSGEQPGEPEYPKPCSTCGTHYDACTTRIRSGKKACCGTCGYTATHEQNAWEERERKRAMVRPAPVVPDSPDVRERVDVAIHRVLSARSSQGLPVETLAERLTDAVLAVVGQGVTADGVPEQIARYVEATATDLSPSGYRAGIATAVRLIRRWRPECVAVRPSGQEGS